MIEPIRDQAGTLTGFAKVTRDVTAERQAEEVLNRAREQLLQSGKMEAIGQLTGGVAHDFNNLLTVILGNLEIARGDLGSAAEGGENRLQRRIDTAMRGAKRAVMLTQRLLAFSRRQMLAPRPVELNRFIAGEVDFLQRSLGETIEVEAVGGAGLWRVEVDPNEFEGALLNLAVNARDAMPQGGTLTIETSNAFLDQIYCRANPEVIPGQYVLIAVTDNGGGMTKDVLDRAFEPFFSTKTVGEGTGLGLSQVYGFIKQSGGHVKIYSEPGEGTTVKSTCPVSWARSVPMTRRTRLMRRSTGVPARPYWSSKKSMLQDVRDFLVEVLDSLDYRVLSANDAMSALRLLGETTGRIDLLLSDVVLPAINGRELAHQALALRPDLKVLFMTGYSRIAIVHQGRLNPGVEVIQKPVTQRDLANRIRDILDASPHRSD